MKTHVQNYSVLISILLITTLSCNSINSTDCCTNIDIPVFLHYQTVEGENLINSSDEFMEDNIKLYYKNGEDYQYAYSSNLDNPDYYEVIEDSLDLILEVLPSTTFFDDDFSETLIEFNENVVDTLLCQFDLSNGNIICRSAWLNGTELPNRMGMVVK